MLHEHESVHTNVCLQEHEFVLQPFLHLPLVNSMIAFGTDEFNMNSSQNFPSSICHPFPVGDCRFNTGIHADFQMVDG